MKALILFISLVNSSIVFSGNFNLIEAIQAHKWDEVRLLIKNNPKSVKQIDSDMNWTAFGWLIYEGTDSEKVFDLKLIDLFIKNGIDVNEFVKVDKELKRITTPIGIAVSQSNNLNKQEFGRYKVVKYLLDKGADPNESSACNFMKKCITTPLITAVLQQNLNVVKLLVESGANINFEHPAEKGKSFPLKLAKEGDNQKIATYLVKQGAK